MQHTVHGSSYSDCSKWRNEGWPESSPWSFWLDRHVAGATKARGTAGTGEGRHITHIAVWRSGWHVITATPLLCVHLWSKEIRCHSAQMKEPVREGRRAEDRKNPDPYLPFGLEVRLWVVGGWRPAGMYFHLQLSGSLLYCKGWDNGDKPKSGK